jgi:hypothetical protein
MNDEQFDRKISDALSAEAGRARPSSDAWVSITEGVEARRVPWLLVGGAAAALLLVAGLVAVFVLSSDDETAVDVVTEPTVETTTSTSTTLSTTTTVPPESAVVYDPIDMGPLPPTRSAPPETLIAVQPDGTLVHVETTTGRLLEEIANHGDLRDVPDEGSPSGIDGVALSPDGDTVLASICCEPAGGDLRWTSISRAGELQLFASSYAPAFSSSPRWAMSSSYGAWIWDLEDGLSSVMSRSIPPGDAGGFQSAALSTGGSHLALVEWGDVGGAGPLRIIDPSNVEAGEQVPAGTSWRIVDDAPLVVDGTSWAEPVFARDGSLLAIELADDGSWSPWIIDPATGSRSAPRLPYEDGILLDQDYDPSAEWLLYVVAPSQETLEGTLHWIGPNGERGTVPGNFYAASW